MGSHVDAKGDKDRDRMRNDDGHTKLDKVMDGITIYPLKSHE